jgi:pyruvate, orthophosphate dikinase
LPGAKGHPVILVRIETSPEDIKGMDASEGILTARGGMTSHAALVARQMGKVCVAGCGALKIDYKAREMRVDGKDVVIREGDYISIDGSTGEVIAWQRPDTPSAKCCRCSSTRRSIRRRHPCTSSTKAHEVGRR